MSVMCRMVSSPLMSLRLCCCLVAAVVFSLFLFLLLLSPEEDRRNMLAKAYRGDGDLLAVEYLELELRKWLRLRLTEEATAEKDSVRDAIDARMTRRKITTREVELELPMNVISSSFTFGYFFFVRCAAAMRATVLF